jgi:hypothetical protein
VSWPSSSDPVAQDLRQMEQIARLEYLQVSGQAGPDVSDKGRSINRSGAIKAAFDRWKTLHDMLRAATPVEAATPVRTW